MAVLDVSRLMAHRIPDVEDRCDADGAILYALGVGAGLSPDIDELPFLHEPQLQILPTMAFVLGTRGFWPMDPGCGLDWLHILHGEQRLSVHRALRPGQRMRGRTRIVELADKGPGKSALIRAEKTLQDDEGQLMATAVETWVVRGAGGFGGVRSLADEVQAVAPDRPPDHEMALPTSLAQAAIYRLSGDRNPLHIEDSAARLAGFDRPILHGLSTLGLAARALVSRLCGGDAVRLRTIDARFTAPVYPGETVQVMIWEEMGDCLFRCRVVERDVPVMEGRCSAAAA